ncbi:lysozyme inhibitor LprI family protein [Billgrantia diversa]|uniref:lysozyme inhibitor LprI family protein n=1 Tax=Halomonas sp. MCCC 1A13316 TaxID=2733487 RepID=UPI0018D400C2|nr:lysozyme inhibitor LprI family protein [Halomonas sp. MCCC 1A13316]
MLRDDGINYSDYVTEHALKIGDVVLGRRGQMGRSAVIQSSQPLLCGTGSLFLRPDLSRISSDFLSLFLRSPRTVYALEAGSAGSTMVNLNQKVLKGVAYPDVGLDEQEQIVRRVDQLFAFADQVEQQVKNAQARVDKLTQSILAKAFRGELTVEWRAANPELISGENSAEALLERIKAEKARQKPTGRGSKKRMTGNDRVTAMSRKRPVEVRGRETMLKCLFVAALCLGSISMAQADELYTGRYASCMDESGGVTANMMDCIGEELRTQDARLNGAYQGLRDELPEERRQQLLEA